MFEQVAVIFACGCAIVGLIVLADRIFSRCSGEDYRERLKRNLEFHRQALNAAYLGMGRYVNASETMRKMSAAYHSQAIADAENDLSSLA